MTLSWDLRKRVLQAWEQGEGTKTAIAARFKVSRTTVRRWINEGAHPPERPETRGRPAALDAEAFERLRRLDEKHPDATQTELAEMLAAPDEQPLHRSIIGRALQKMGRTRKKRRGRPPSESARTSSARE